MQRWEKPESDRLAALLRQAAQYSRSVLWGLWHRVLVAALRLHGQSPLHPLPKGSLSTALRTRCSSWSLKAWSRRTRTERESLGRARRDLFFLALIGHLTRVHFLAHCCKFLCRRSKRQVLNRDWLHRILQSIFKSIKCATKERSCSLLLPFQWQMTAVKLNSCFSLFMKHLFPFVWKTNFPAL